MIKLKQDRKADIDEVEDLLRAINNLSNFSLTPEQVKFCKRNSKYVKENNQIADTELVGVHNLLSKVVNKESGFKPGKFVRLF